MIGFDLFSGAGGMALAAELAGINIKAFCEKKKYATRLLRSKWPGKKIYNDITLDTEIIISELSGKVDIIWGGDPCQSRSTSKFMPTKIPDLSGYFLSVVAGVAPKFVVRENVCAPDVKDFVFALELLGYDCAVIRSDASSFTGQSRIRDFVVGFHKERACGFKEFISKFTPGSGPSQKIPALGQIVSCFATKFRDNHPSRNYIWNQKFGLRVLDAEERARFAGFPEGWFSWFSEATAIGMIGEAVVPQAAYPIFKAIVETQKIATKKIL